VTQAVPLIYSRPPTAPNLTRGTRILLLALALGCLAVLIIAAVLKPVASGLGTHAELGLAPCGFLVRTGLPCLSCGMTTSLSWFVRGNLLASFYVQPMGCVLALATAMTFWIALYGAITAKPIGRVLAQVQVRYYIVPLLSLAILAWGWKMFIHLRGMDGWQ
jgi:hypothetical protein